MSTIFVTFFVFLAVALLNGVTLADRNPYARFYKRLQFTSANGAFGGNPEDLFTVDSRLCQSARDYCMFAHVNRDTGRIAEYPGWCACGKGSQCEYSHMNHQKQWIFRCQKGKQIDKAVNL